MKDLAKVVFSQVDEDVAYFTKPPLGSARAMRVPIENFAGYYGTADESTTPSPLRLIVDAAGQSKDFSVFDSQLLEVLLLFKWQEGSLEFPSVSLSYPPTGTIAPPIQPPIEPPQPSTATCS